MSNGGFLETPHTPRGAAPWTRFGTKGCRGRPVTAILRETFDWSG